MTESTSFRPSVPAISSRDALTEVLQQGARELLAAALEVEIQAYLDAHADFRDAAGHRLVTRNGFLPEREIQTGIGPVAVRQPRLRDRRAHSADRFRSQLLPPYLRRTKSMEELLPWLYLKGVSSGDFGDALHSLLGPDAPGLSASTIVRLKKAWEEDYAAWSRRSLADRRYVYLWVDGIHFNIRLEDHRSCILVVIGATADGRKELVAGLHEIWMAPTRKEAERAFDRFLASYGAKYPKATACLEKDREQLLAFYDFPAEHWKHLRTTNPIESTFATVRLRTAKTKGVGSRVACLTMVFQLALSAQKRWRKLNGHALLAEVIRGVRFQDGIRSIAA